VALFEIATRAANFIRAHLLDDFHKTLFLSYQDGRSALEAFAADYAFALNLLLADGAEEEEDLGARRKSASDFSSPCEEDQRTTGRRPGLSSSASSTPFLRSMITNVLFSP